MTYIKFNNYHLILEAMDYVSEQILNGITVNKTRCKEDLKHLRLLNKMYKVSENNIIYLDKEDFNLIMMYIGIK